MKAFIALSLVLAGGCAGTTAAKKSNGEFPSRISKPEIPAADRLATEIVRHHRGVVTAQVKLCVLPTGEVEAVKLVSSSGFEAYDQAVLDTVSDWEYEPTAMRVCEKLSLSYRTP